MPVVSDGRGEASEVVFDGVGVQLARAEQGEVESGGRTNYWRDSSMSFRPELTPWEKAVWSETPRRCLHRPRRIHLDRRSETYLYFEQVERYQYRCETHWLR